MARKSKSRVSVAAAAAPARQPRDFWLTAGICCLLAAITLAVFGRTSRYEFVNFDDNIYVYENAQVAQGLTWSGVAWAFTHPAFHLYHPLTIVSLMADHQFHGLDAGWYHITNVLLHTGAVVLLFLVLSGMTGALWPSAFVAAVFAIHPLRVESVAWVAERKDVLAAFFFMLTIGAYLHYVRKNSLARFLMVAAAFALALLSKPSVVTLPFVLLLLDYWPLRRFGQPGKVSRLILEKIPLLALAAGISAVTIMTTQGMPVPGNPPSMPARCGNALVYYAIYLRQLVWPTGLAVDYPNPPHGFSFGEIALAGALFAGLSALAWISRRTRPWIAVGWLWYLGMLLPTIGLKPVGAFAQADRFTYLPHIGIYAAFAWQAAEWGAKFRVNRIVAGGLMAMIVGLLMVLSWKQTAVWRNNETLWPHALACTQGNNLAWNNLGFAVLQKGKTDAAILDFQRALQIDPNYGDAELNLSDALSQTTNVDEALAHSQRAVQLKPGDAKARNNLGNALLRKGRADEAIVEFTKALQIKPGLAGIHNNLGNALLQKGQTDEAIAQYQEALRIEPGLKEAQAGLGDAYYRLGRILRKQGRLDEAIADEQKTLQISPKSPEAWLELGNAFLQKGSLDEAVASYQKALQLRPGYPDAHNNLGYAYFKQGKLDEAIAEYRTALRLNPNDPGAESNLRAALAKKDEGHPKP